MKKLLAAVTSIVMSASFATSAFASSMTVSAAGGVSAVQPNVSMGEMLDASANKNAMADFIVTAPDFTIAPGESKMVDFTVDAGSHKGIMLRVKVGTLPNGLTYELGSQYIDAVNGGKSRYEKVGDEFHASIMDADSEPVAFEKGGSVLTLKVTAPANAKLGSESIGLELFEVIEDAFAPTEYQATIKKGTVTIAENGQGQGQATTKPADPTQPAQTGTQKDFVITGKDITMKPGETKEVEFSVSAGSHQFVLAQCEVDFPSELTFAMDKAYAYCGMKDTKYGEVGNGQYSVNLTNPDTSEAITLNESEPIFYCKVTAPEGTPNGTYLYGFKSYHVVEDAFAPTEFEATVNYGKIIVDDGTGNTTPGSTKPSEPTQPQQTGTQKDFVITGKDITMKPGETKEVEFSVSAGSHQFVLGQCEVDFPSELTFAMDKAYAYCGMKDTKYGEVGNGQYSVNLTNPDTSEAITLNESEPIFYCKVTAPEGTPNGTYLYGFKSYHVVEDAFAPTEFEATVNYGKIIVDDGTGSVTPGTSTTKPADPTQPAQVDTQKDFVITGKDVKAKPGDTVEVEFSVSAGGHKFVLGQCETDFPSGFEFQTEKAYAYCGMKDTKYSILGGNQMTVNLTNPDTSEAIDLNESEPIFYCKVTIPENTSNGTYLYGFKEYHVVEDSFIPTEFNATVVYGKIIVDDGTGNNTTPDKPPVVGEQKDFVITGKDVKVKPGDTAEVEFAVSSNGHKFVLGQCETDFPEGFKFQTDKAYAYCGLKDVKYGILGGNQMSVNLTNPDTSEAIDLNDNEPIFYCKVTIPENTPNGTYYYGFKSYHVVEDAFVPTEFEATVVYGKIIVDDGTGNNTTPDKPPVVGEQKDFVITGKDVEAKAGETVEVEFAVSSNGHKFVLGQCETDFPEGFEFQTDKAYAYCGLKDVKYGILGGNQMSVNLTNPDTSEAIDLNDNEPIFYCKVTIPEGTPAGKYYYGFKSYHVVEDAFVPTEFEATVVYGTITVVDPSVSSAISTNQTNVTTTTTTIDYPLTTEYSETWSIDNVTAAPGEIVDVNVKLNISAGGLGFFSYSQAGVQFGIDPAVPITVAGASLKSSVFNNGSVIFNPDTNEFAVATPDGSAITSSGVVMTIRFKVPENAAAGKYDLKWVSPFISNVDGREHTGASFVNGSITVDPKASSGKIEWAISDVTASAGTKVEVPVLVKDTAGAALAVAGAQFQIDAKTPVALDAAAGSEAYKANAVYNKATGEVAFGEKAGAGVAAANGAQVIVLTFDVPAGTAAGVYPIDWSNAFITDTNGNDITANVKLTSGSITVTANDGKVSWIIPKVKANAGDTVEMNVTVSAGDDNIGVAGAQFNISAADPIKLGGAYGSDAYATGIVRNSATNEFAFGNAKGEAVKAADGSVVLKLIFEVPDSCEGTYDVKWSDAFISDENGNDITANVTLVDGSIEVERTVITDSATQPIDTTTTTTSTTVTVAPPVGGVIWQAGTVTAEPGETVAIDVIVKDPNKSGLPVAGAQFALSAAAPIKYRNCSELSDAYKAAIISNADTNEFAFANAAGLDVASVNDAKVITVYYEVPADCPEGTYPVVFSKDFMNVTTSDDIDITTKVLTLNGAIIVEKKADVTTAPDTTEPDVTTTTTTTGEESATTTTTVSYNDGIIMWHVGTETVTAGDIAELDVIVENPFNKDVPVAGAQFIVEVDGQIIAIPCTGADALSEAYNASVVSNGYEYAFANAEGKDVVAADGQKVLKLKFQVPAEIAPGTYPVNLVNVEAYDTNENDVQQKIIVMAGAIIVRPAATVTTTTTTTTGSETETTTTTTAVSGEDTTATTTTTVSGADTTATTTTTAVSGEDTTATTTTTVSGADTTATTTTTAVSGEDTTATTTTTVSGADTTATTTTTAVSGEDTTATTTTTVSGADTTATTTTTVSGADTTATTTTTAVSGEDTTATTTTTAVSGEDTTATTTTESGQPGTETTATTESGQPGTETTVTTGGTIPGTTATLPVGAVGWQLNNAAGVPGQEVTLTLVVNNPGNSQINVSGGSFVLNTIPEIVGSEGMPYGAKLTYNPETGEFAFANGKGFDAPSVDGAVLATITFKIPENATPGTIYDVLIGNIVAVDGNEVDLSGNILGGKGMIVVMPDPAATTTTTGSEQPADTTTTTTESGQPADTTTTTSATGADTETTTASTTVTGADTETTTASTSVTGADTETTTASTTVTGADTETTTASTSETGADTETTTASTTVTSADTETTTASTSETGADTETTTASTTVTSADTETTTASTTGSDTETSTTTGATSQLPGSETGTTTTRPTLIDAVGVEATVETVDGFYFSHDPRAIKKAHVIADEIVITNADGSQELTEFDPAYLYFEEAVSGKETPLEFFRRDTNVYTINVFYGGKPLMSNGVQVTFKVFVGVKGDTNFDNAVDAKDASNVLSYYAELSTGGTAESAFLSPDHHDLDELAAFLADVDLDVYSEGNWNTPKARRSLDSKDASSILAFYAAVSTGTTDPHVAWNMTFDYLDPPREDMFAEYLK